MYSNLEAEMRRHGISNEECAEAIGKDVRTFRNKKNGISDFSISESRMIRDLFFPTLELDYLFEQKVSG